MPISALITAAVGLLMQILVLWRLIFRNRKYPALLLYILALIAATIVETVSYIQRNVQLYRRAYWTDEIVLDILVFMVALSFINRALRNDRRRTLILSLLLVAALTVAAVSSAFVQTSMDDVMTGISRNLLFFATVINLVLWILLIRSGAIDRYLLLLSGALGIQTTGETITHALHYFLHAPSTDWISSTVSVLTHLACMFIWWKALGQEFEESPRQAPPVNTRAAA